MAKPPKFDKNLADSFVGKYALIGLTYQDHLGNETNRVQMHGVIESASPKGIVVSLRGSREGTSWNMPPGLDSIHPAKPGNYTLHSTNETIENPDLLCTWVIHAPPPKRGQSS